MGHERLDKKPFNAKAYAVSLLIAVVVALGLMPAGAFASTGLHGDTNRNGTIDVTLTISDGTDDFYETATSDRLLLQELHVPYFDLELYGLEGYYYNPNCYASGYQVAGDAEMAEGYVTTMHVIIYATEVYMCGIDPSEAGKGLGAEFIAGHGSRRQEGQYLSWTGGVGSSFMTFWNNSTNLNYFLDYKYPLGRPGWGSTSDQQALQDGAAIELHLIKDPNVQGSQYGFFADADDARDFGSVTEGAGKTLTLYTTNSWYGGTNDPSPLANTAVYMVSEDAYRGECISQWTVLGKTDANGRIEIPATTEPGTYYVASPGQVVGSSERAPAIYVLNVMEARDVALYGDADGDGTVTAKDATLILRKVAQMPVDIDAAAADVDGDGSLTAKDATLILRYVAQAITSFPVEEINQ